MERGQQKIKGMMSSKLVMSFYRAAKPGPEVVIKSVDPSLAMQKVSAFKKQQSSFGRSDGYIHGPDGGGGDCCVDNKASSYISYVKEQRILEELVITDNITAGIMEQDKSAN